MYRKGDALSPLLLNCASEYAIMGVQTNQEGLKLNGTYRILVYTDNINIWSGNVHSVKKK
jgi:hypothetical protein